MSDGQTTWRKWSIADTLRLDTKLTMKRTRSYTRDNGPTNRRRPVSIDNQYKSIIVTTEMCIKDSWKELITCWLRWLRWFVIPVGFLFKHVYVILWYTMILYDTIPLVNRPGVTKLFELATVLAPVCHIFQMGWWYPWSGNADQPDAVRPCHWCWDSHWTYPGGQHFRSKWEL